MTRICYVAAPACLLGYGILRLIDGLDGSHGPGPAWSAGHLLFLASMLLFAIVLYGLWQALPRYRAAGAVAVVAGVVGVLAFCRVILVDLIVGFESVDRAAMNRDYGRYDGFPGGLPSGFTGALDNVGPPLLIVGLLTLTILLASLRPRRLRWWSPVAILAGFVAISASLDLLPLGGALLGVALLPMALSGRTGAAVVPA
jgi:hypothetical protein